MSVKEVGSVTGYRGLHQKIDETIIEMNRFYVKAFQADRGKLKASAFVEGSTLPYQKFFENFIESKFIDLRDCATEFPGFRSWKLVELADTVKSLQFDEKYDALRKADDVILSLLDVKKQVSKEEKERSQSEPSLTEQVKELANRVQELSSEILKLKDSIRDLEEKAREKSVRERRATSIDDFRATSS